jgi:hypothetical protein
MHPATCYTSVVFPAALAANRAEEDLESHWLAALIAWRGGDILERFWHCRPIIALV